MNNLQIHKFHLLYLNRTSPPPSFANYINFKKILPTVELPHSQDKAENIFQTFLFPGCSEFRNAKEF